MIFRGLLQIIDYILKHYKHARLLIIPQENKKNLIMYTCFSVPYVPYNKNGDKWRQYNLKDLFKYDRKDCWNAVRDITTVKNTVAQSSMTVARYAYTYNGEFYDQTIYSHKAKAITAPRKASSALNECSKYGGYKSQNRNCKK